MKEMINTYSEEYSAELKKLSHLTDDLRKVNHPVLFIFIGDDSLDALKAVYHSNRSKWSNHDGVMYLFAYTKTSFEGENVFSFNLPNPSAKLEDFRKALRQEFYKDEDRIIKLNQLIRRLNGSLTDTGKYYSQFDSLNISVITRIDDPANVIIPEITVLTKKILKESFKSVNVELYGLLKEKNDLEYHHRTTAFGISFLRELQYYQGNRYTFSAQLEITEDRIPMTVELDTKKLFSLVYLLSDRDEEGKTDAENMKTNYEIISTLNLLKNRSTVKSTDSQNEYYDNSKFIQAIQANFDEAAYASAGFSKVVRPNKTIAITVLYHLVHYYAERTKRAAEMNKQKILSILGLDEFTVESKISSFLPSKKLLEQSAVGKMQYPVSFQQLRGMTMKSAEQALYKNGCEASFIKMFEEPAYSTFDPLKLKEDLAALIRNQVVTVDQYGIYCAYYWTKEDDEVKGIVQDIRDRIKMLVSEVERTKERLTAEYENVVETEHFKWSNFPFSEKKNIQSFSKHLITKMYGIKYDLLALEMKLEYLRQIELGLTEIHQLYRRQIEQFEELEDLLYQMTKNAIELETDYLGRNIFEYYEKVVSVIFKEFEEKRGEHFYFEERFFGNIGVLLEVDQGIDQVLSKFIEVSRKDVLVHPEFSRTVEDELLERSNLDVSFYNDEVLTKTGLFKELYSRLNQHSIINIDLSEANLSHRYEEKYFFGDYNSEFIQWAFNYDRDGKTHKLGCVHEENSTGIERLNIMGGFKITDLRYWINYYQNYEHYHNIGFHFHGLDETLLPVMADSNL